jgi:hypothetical protein
MDGDFGNDENFPQTYIDLGYPIGEQSKNVNPDFKKPDDLESHDFTPKAKETFGTSLPIQLNLPDGYQIEIDGGNNVGAVQHPAFYEKLDRQFEFLPDLTWPYLTNLVF